ncbi:MAG: hypothetical protein ACXV95_00860 [Acidimicrobiales bacterium]
MAGASGAGGGQQQRQTVVVVAVLVGLGLVLTVAAVVFRSHDDRKKDTVAAVPTTATTAVLPPGASTTTAPAGPAGITYNDPNKIFHMTLGPDWTEGPNGAFNSPTWLAPVPGGTAQINPLLSRAAGPDSLAEFVRSTVTRIDSGPLYRTSTSEPTTLADGTPATIVHYRSSTGALLEGRALVVVKGLWGMTMLVQCPPDGADACFAALDPFVKSLSFT